LNASTNDSPSNKSAESKNNNKRPRKRGGRKKKTGSRQQGNASAINHSGVNKKSPNKNRNKKAGASKNNRNQPKKPLVPTEDFSVYKAPEPKTYQFKEFDNFKAAHADISSLSALAESCDQLNVIIKAEGNMEDEQILEASPKITIYAGEAWYLIHTRRLEEKWYDSQH
jgi:hypothetical protein